MDGLCSKGDLFADKGQSPGEKGTDMVGEKGPALVRPGNIQKSGKKSYLCVIGKKTTHNRFLWRKLGRKVSSTIRAEKRVPSQAKNV